MEIKQNILFFDTETTGILKGESWNIISNWELIQLAYRKFTNLWDAKEFKKLDKNLFFNTDTQIDISSMAIHWIYKKFLLEKSGWKYLENDLKNKIKKDFENTIIVAHNIDFDKSVLENSWISFSSQQIDTLKVAKIMLSEWVLLNNKGQQAEYTNLQYLRYFFELYEILDENWYPASIKAHDAFWDVIVLEQVFYVLFKTIKDKLAIQDDQVIDKMIEMTKKEFILIKTMRVWKYRWKTFEEVSVLDKWYLNWMLNADFSEDIKYTCRVWLWELEDRKFFNN